MNEPVELALNLNFKAEIQQFCDKVEHNLAMDKLFKGAVRRDNKRHKEHIEGCRKRCLERLAKMRIKSAQVRKERARIKAEQQPPPSEYVIIQDWSGRKVRIKRKNARRIKMKNRVKRNRILKQLHNTDMSTQPKESLEQPYTEEYASSDKNLPRAVSKGIDRSQFRDVEPLWYAEDPRKRISWKAFCEDFLGQNYGSVAQALLEVYQQDKALFLKYALEMGKQTIDKNVNVDLNANVKATGDIYAQLKAMSQASVLPSADIQQIEAAPEYDALPAPQEPQKEKIMLLDESNLHIQDEQDCNNQDTKACMSCPKYDHCGMPVCHYAHEFETIRNLSSTHE